MSFISAILESSASDVRCFPLCSRNFDSQQSCSFKIRENQNFDKKLLKIFFKTMIAQNLWVMSERHLITALETHLTSLAEFGSSPFQDGGNEIHFIQTQRLFSDKQNR